MKDQIVSYMNRKLSGILSGFREGYGTQHAPIRVVEEWWKRLDSSKIVGTVLMDLSKAYDCLPNDLLIANLWAYGFHLNSLYLISSYLEGCP